MPVMENVRMIRATRFSLTRRPFPRSSAVTRVLSDAENVHQGDVGVVDGMG
jgi:hypothetical protein